MPNRIRIACSGLSGRIYAGRINEAQTEFVGTKYDVTSDFLKALAEYAKLHDGEFEIRQDGELLFSVKLQAARTRNSEEDTQPEATP